MTAEQAFLLLFREAWTAAALEGACDDLDGAQYDAAAHEWLLEGMYDAALAWIYIRANSPVEAPPTGEVMRGAAVAALKRLRGMM